MNSFFNDDIEVVYSSGFVQLCLHSSGLATTWVVILWKNTNTSHGIRAEHPFTFQYKACGATQRFGGTFFINMNLIDYKNENQTWISLQIEPLPGIQEASGSIKKIKHKKKENKWKLKYCKITFGVAFLYGCSISSAVLWPTSSSIAQVLSRCEPDKRNSQICELWS